MDTIYASFRNVIENDINLIKYYAMNRDTADGPTVAAFYQMVSSGETTTIMTTVDPDTTISNDIKAILDYFDCKVIGGVVDGTAALYHIKKALPFVNVDNYIVSDLNPENRSVLQYVLESLDTPNHRVCINPDWARFY